MKNKPKIVITSAILLIVVITSLAMKYQSTKKQSISKKSTVPTVSNIEPTKSYSNNFYSVKYPNSYDIEIKPYATSREYPSVLSNIELINKVGNTISITVSENFLHLSLDNALGKGPALSYVNDYMKSKASHKLALTNSNAITIQDLAAGQTGPTDDCIIIHDSKIYQIVLSPSDKRSKSEYMSLIQSFEIVN